MIDGNSVYVWWVGLEASAFDSETQLASWSGMLSVEERSKADAFRREDSRRDYILAHAALRSVLGQCLGISPASVRFAAGSVEGLGATAIKPALMPTSGPKRERSDLRFNLSHTLGAALIGAALGRELGIDIERQRPLDNLNTMARSVMSAEELAQWQTLESGDRSRAFYHVWTRKESYLKAIGLGLYHSLQEVTVPVSVNSLDPSSGDFGIVQDRTREGIWSVTDIPVPEVYSASICCEGAKMPAIVIQEFDLGSML